MTQLFIDIKGANKIIADLRQDRHAKVAKMLRTVTFKIKRAVQAAAPIRTGKLRRSIKARQYSQLKWVVQEEVLYGKYQREGTRQGGQGGYFIFPRRKKALFWPGLGHPIEFVGPPVTRLHPGIQKPIAYDKLGIEASKADIDLFITKVAKTYTLSVNKTEQALPE